MSPRIFKTYPLLKHLAFWLCASALLTYLYATAFESFRLGMAVILLLLPVHLLYFYSINKFVIRHFFIREQYLSAFVTAVCILIGAAFFYRAAEVFITDPYIFHFYQQNDPSFTWERMQWSYKQQLLDPILFVTAIERSNAVVWIGITLKLFALSNERKQSALKAELNLLKAQLHPHFLFNSLNNIYSLALNGSEKTAEVVLGISNILRYSLYECNVPKVPLKRDIEILKDYIKLEQIRYEERLELNVFLCQDTGHLQIAPMLMLPLVENAFKHGTAVTVGTPWINIQLHISEQQLILNISNSNAEDQVVAGNSPGKIGIDNVRKRLDLLYPGNFSLEFFDESDCFITVLHLNLKHSP